MKTCTVCLIEKPISEFYKRASCKDGIDTRCKACNLAQHRALYKRRGRAPQGKATPSWVKGNLSLEMKIRRWHLWTMMRQRNITFVDIGNVMECSRQRIDQLLQRAKLEDFERLENAITYITIKRHQEAGHRDNDLYCGVYTACGMDEKVAQAKAAGEREYEQAS